MKDTEKKNLEQDESVSINNENEFQELDNEIEKVVRGEASYEEDQLDKNHLDLNNSQNTLQDYAKLKNLKNKFPINFNGLFVNNNEEQNILLKNKNNRKQNNKNNSNFINSMNKCVINPNESNNIKNFTNLNLNLNIFENTNAKNNQNQNKRIQNITQNINSFNNNCNTINNYIYNTNCNNNKINNNYNQLNELILQNINNSNNIYLKELIKNNNNINSNELLNYILFLNNLTDTNQNINNLDILYNVNMYNNQLLQNLIDYLNSPSQNLNDLYNNTIITNHIINSNDKKNQIYNLLNNNFHDRCDLTSNDFKKIINNELSHYMQIENNNSKSGLFPCNNPTINNKNINENIMFNNLISQINNNNNIMDLFVNNCINNNNTNIFNNNEYNSNIFSKRKLFNPLSDCEKETNFINLMDIFLGKDLRTTLMIKNIPNKYTIPSFLEEINKYFKNTYDIFYLPIDYINKCNLGFAFINFVEPLHIILFYELYRGKKWKKFKSGKKCELLYAKYQGRKELISHFEKGKVLTFENEDKRPLILPEPCQFPKIRLPCYYLNLFIKLYPQTKYIISNINNKNIHNSILKVFVINGNFTKLRK